MLVLYVCICNVSAIWISLFGLWASVFGLRSSGFGLRALGFGLRASGYGPSRGNLIFQNGNIVKKLKNHCWRQQDISRLSLATVLHIEFLCPDSDTCFFVKNVFDMATFCLIKTIFLKNYGWWKTNFYSRIYNWTFLRKIIAEFRKKNSCLLYTWLIWNSYLFMSYPMFYGITPLQPFLNENQSSVSDVTVFRYHCNNAIL